MKHKILITGAAGFIGSNFVKQICIDEYVRNKFNFLLLDSLTYASCYSNIEMEVLKYNNIDFLNLDISNTEDIDQLFKKEMFDGVINFAAESHNDRALKSPNLFFSTNVIGTLNLLNSSLYNKNKKFKFLQVSTDEVYGSLDTDDQTFKETDPLNPSNPYSASKASADLVVLSFFKTYKLPILITRCSNNYGPYQHEEKFIPQMTKLAKSNLKLTLYGTGKNIRDWIHVSDHVNAIWKVFCGGRVGEIYNIGGNTERNNFHIAQMILKRFGKSNDMIEFIADRTGHDWRYGIDYSKIDNELNWNPERCIEDYIENELE